MKHLWNMSRAGSSIFMLTKAFHYTHTELLVLHVQYLSSRTEASSVELENLGLIQEAS